MAKSQFVKPQPATQITGAYNLLYYIIISYGAAATDSYHIHVSTLATLAATKLKRARKADMANIMQKHHCWIAVFGHTVATLHSLQMAIKSTKRPGSRRLGPLQQ